MSPLTFALSSSVRVDEQSTQRGRTDVRGSATMAYYTGGGLLSSIPCNNNGGGGVHKREMVANKEVMGPL